MRPARRAIAASKVRELVESLDGSLTNECAIPEINYHGIIGTIPRQSAQMLVAMMDQPSDIDLLRCEDIMFVRPTGQCTVSLPEDVMVGSMQPTDRDLPIDVPLVALLDGLPLENHRLIDGRVTVDDPDQFETAYLPGEQVHGTAMSSLICHDDINAGQTPITRQLYVRPIMKPRRGFAGQFVEEIPSNEMPVDLVHRAVRRLFEGDDIDPPAAPSVRVVNLSIGDRSRPFDRLMSPFSRLLDWLSEKYNILFIVSAGNYPGSLTLDVPRDNLPGLGTAEIAEPVIRSLARETRNRRLLSPAETMNGLTVGSVHEDASNRTLPNLIDPFKYQSMPSVLNAHGPGHRKTIKPELFMPGGRQQLVENPVNVDENAVLDTSVFGGQLVAHPGTAGALNQVRYAIGTSNAAALASRAVHFIYDVIVQLRQSSPSHIGGEYDAVLLKALLAHGANWGDAYKVFEDALKTSENSIRFKEYVGRFLGYGATEAYRVCQAPNNVQH